MQHRRWEEQQHPSHRLHQGECDLALYALARLNSRDWQDKGAVQASRTAATRLGIVHAAVSGGHVAVELVEVAAASIDVHPRVSYGEGLAIPLFEVGESACKQQVGNR